MKFFIVNSGSSSIKYQVIEMETEAVLATGLVDKLGGLRDAIEAAAGYAALEKDAYQVSYVEKQPTPFEAYVSMQACQFYDPTLGWVFKGPYNCLYRMLPDAVLGAVPVQDRVEVFCRSDDMPVILAMKPVGGYSVVGGG